LRLGGMNHAVAHETGERLVVEMLQLASAAHAEVTARRRGVVRARQQCAVLRHDVARRGQGDMAARRGDAVAFRGDADNRFRFAHKAAA
jgi:hypothetical protein